VKEGKGKGENSMVKIKSINSKLKTKCG
jgi:hypothetical protein